MRKGFAESSSREVGGRTEVLVSSMLFQDASILGLSVSSMGRRQKECDSRTNEFRGRQSGRKKRDIWGGGVQGSNDV